MVIYKHIDFKDQLGLPNTTTVDFKDKIGTFVTLSRVKVCTIVLKYPDGKFRYILGTNDRGFIPKHKAYRVAWDVKDHLKVNRTMIIKLLNYIPVPRSKMQSQVDKIDFILSKAEEFIFNPGKLRTYPKDPTRARGWVYEYSKDKFTTFLFTHLVAIIVPE